MSQVHGKVALITGGAAGMGIEFAKELLRNGLKGVALADINPKYAEEALKEISREFGANKVIFIPTDVTNKIQVEDAFKKTVEKFKQIDIVINNAGILEEINFEKEVAVNCNGVVYGTLLAINEYFPNYKSKEEGIVVNIASLFGLDASIGIPIYSGTKFFVVGFSESIGSEIHYKRTKTRVLTICPGITETNIVKDAFVRNLGPAYNDILTEELNSLKFQKASHMGKELITVLEKGKTGSVWLIEGSQPAAEVKHIDRFERSK